MHGLSSFGALVSTAKNGFQSLDDDFYGKVDACITRLEKGLPPP